MDWSEITALAGIATAFAAFGALYVAYRAFRSQEISVHKSNETFRLSINADLVMRLEEQFDGEVMRRSRRSAAKALLENQHLSEAEDVFDFFETVGLLSRLEALNEEMVHSTFFHWINAYWVAGRNYISEKREEKSAVLWVDFESVYETTRALERRKDAHSRDLNPPQELIASYLREELEECRD